MLRGGVVQGARRALCAARAPFRPLSAGNRAHPAPPSPLLCERGLPRPPPAGQALSPFAALGLPQAFDVDAAEVEAAYKRLQRALHPDRFAASGDAGVTAAAEGAAAAANAAVAALRDPLLRAEALLAARGEQGAEKQAAADPALLMEVMEMDEAAEAAAAKGVEALTAMHQQLAGKVDAEVGALAEAFGAGDDARAARVAVRLRFVRRVMRDVRDNMPH